MATELLSTTKAARYLPPNNLLRCFNFDLLFLCCEMWESQLSQRQNKKYVDLPNLKCYRSLLL